MDVHVTVLKADFIKESNWFIQIELEEVSYPTKAKIKKKQRTDVYTGITTNFSKNHFVFKGSLSNRLSIKFGAIELSTFNEKRNIDPSKCICQGMYTLVITKRLLAALRDQIPLKETYKLLHPTSKVETCALNISLSLDFFGIDEKIIENERVFMKVEYDRYEQDKSIIQDKEEKVENLLEINSQELTKWIDKVDHVKNALRSLGADVSLLKKQKDSLELENKDIFKIIERLSKVDDIHIKVDMLSTSPQGIDILRLIMEKTDNRLKLQRKIYEELSSNWMKIEGKKRKFELLKEEVNKVKDAQSQLEFHMQTLKDQLPQALVLRDQIKSMDGLIKDFEGQIAKARKIKKDKAIEVEVVNLKHKHNILIEKQKQVQIILETNEGFVPLEEIEKLQIDYYNDDTESEALKKRGDELLKEIEEVGQALSKDSFRPKSRSNNLIELEVKLQAAQARVEAIQERMTKQAADHGIEIGKYEAKLAELDSRLLSYDSL